MEHHGVYREIEERFGIVPEFLKKVPESVLTEEWNLLRKLEIDDSQIPDKYRDLIGLAVSSAIKCQYCTYLYTESLRQNGVSDEEIKLAVSLAKSTTGWSTFLYGMQMNLDEFRRDASMFIQHLKEHRPVGV
jgi:AhpD family alkylhydroperoxidase